MASVRGLKAYEHAHALAVRCKRACDGFPPEERFRLAGQLRSAAFGVPLNIAEGFGRSSSVDFRRFLVMARASLDEVEAALRLAVDCGYMNQSDYEDLERRRDEAARTLYGLIRATDRRIANR